MGKVVVNCEYFDNTLGCAVHVITRREAKRFTARWREGKVYVYCPCDVSPEEFRQAMDHMTPTLLKRSRRTQFYIGQTIETPGYRFTIIDSGKNDTDIFAAYSSTDTKIHIGRQVDLEAHSNVVRVSKLMLRVAYKVAPRILFDHARQTAARLGVSPDAWKISNGLRIMGKCTANRTISLSAILLFAPWHLREYVICHELAHLTHLNHSPAFHQLLDSYLEGREKALKRELDSYSWPLLR